MILHKVNPPRAFRVLGADKEITLYDCCHILLEENEQVTFVSNGGSEYDVVRKEWGYYATPSTNKRLRSFGFRSAIIINGMNNLFIMLVETGKENEFHEYLRTENLLILAWLDTEESILNLKRSIGV